MKTLPNLIILSLAFTGIVGAQTNSTEEAAAADVGTPAPEAVVEAPVIAAEDMATLETKIGSEVIVEGVVRNVGKGSNDSITFLNFGDRRSGFTVVAFRDVYDKFPEGFDNYSGQKVRVRGQLEKFRDRTLQIRLSTPDQIEVIGGGETPSAAP